MMKRLGAFAGVALMGLLVACGPVEEAPGSEDMTSVPQLSPEELASLMSTTPTPDENMVQALAAACQPSTVGSCGNAGYSACGNWSEYVGCGSPTTCSADMPVGCWKKMCPDPGNPGWCYEVAYGARYASKNRYRVCFNPAGESCTEYEKVNFRLACDCLLAEGDEV